MAGKIIRPDDWDEGTLFHAPLHREPDRPTSVQGARDVKHRRTSQAMLFLIEYRNHDLTDEEAAAAQVIAAITAQGATGKGARIYAPQAISCLLEPRGSVLQDHP
jgi:hypothetical protein